MALTVEDGTGVAGANSYDTLDNIRAYATERGVTLPVDADLEKYVHKVMDFIESKRAQFQGLKTFIDQDLQWPRTGVQIDSIAVPTDGAGSIPKELKQALAQGCILVHEGKDLTPTLEGYAVRRRKTDVIETEYATGGSQSGIAYPVIPTFTSLDILLRPLCSASGSGVKVVRK